MNCEGSWVSLSWAGEKGFVDEGRDRRFMHFQYVLERGQDVRGEGGDDDAPRLRFVPTRVNVMTFALRKGTRSGS